MNSGSKRQIGKLCQRWRHHIDGCFKQWHRQAVQWQQFRWQQFDLATSLTVTAIKQFISLWFWGCCTTAHWASVTKCAFINMAMHPSFKLVNKGVTELTTKTPGFCWLHLATRTEQENAPAADSDKKMSRPVYFKVGMMTHSEIGDMISFVACHSPSLLKSTSLVLSFNSNISEPTMRAFSTVLCPSLQWYKFIHSVRDWLIQLVCVDVDTVRRHRVHWLQVKLWCKDGRTNNLDFTVPEMLHYRPWSWDTIIRNDPLVISEANLDYRLLFRHKSHITIKNTKIFDSVITTQPGRKDAVILSVTTTKTSRRSTVHRRPVCSHWTDAFLNKCFCYIECRNSDLWPSELKI